MRRRKTTSVTCAMLLRYDWVVPAKLMGPRSGKSETIVSLEGIVKRVEDCDNPDEALEDLCFAARIMLAELHTDKGARLTWREARTLVSNKLDCGAILRRISWDPLCALGPIISSFAEFGDDGSPLRFRTNHQEWFFSILRYLAEFLNQTAMGSTMGSDSVVRPMIPIFGPSVTDWLQLSLHPESHTKDDPIKTDSRNRAKVLESNLLADDEFLAALNDITRSVKCLTGKRKWIYKYRSELVTILGRNDSPKEELPMDRSLQTRLQQFCRDWCLDSVSSTLGSTGLDGIWISAQRPTVALRDDGTGVDVFLPRFYKYNDLKNWFGVDFNALKKVMETICPISRLQVRDYASKARAKAHMQDLIHEGWDEGSAWDKTMAHMDWRKRTMREYFGARPNTQCTAPVKKRKSSRR